MSAYPEKPVRPPPGQNGVEHLLDLRNQPPLPCQHVNRGDQCGNARDHPTADGVAKVQQIRQSLGEIGGNIGHQVLIRANSLIQGLRLQSKLLGEGLHQAVQAGQIGLHVGGQIYHALRHLRYDQVEQDHNDRQGDQIDRQNRQPTPVLLLLVELSLKKAHGRIEQIGDSKTCNKGRQHTHKCAHPDRDNIEIGQSHIKQDSGQQDDQER
ncbi:Uncharacterised protein [Flavonifractor plautii]|uniref:Uncharacterized protein n=1 Tax=Flavonifractor plautii TaxID=292800 RepID=A0A174C7N9_FLAPL|nr:Uncharacterised protein [Flavonifractor plautii]